MNKPNAIPLTGAQYEIQAGGYQATVTELGAGLRTFSHAGQALITEFADNELPPGGAGQLLAPWPNRIDGGRYEFGGATFQLELSEAAHGNAIHGLTRWTNWTPVAHLASEITMTHTLLGRPGYPFCLELSVHYELDATDGLTVSVTATNAGSQPAPYGTGCHPYLSTGAPLVDTCQLQLPRLPVAASRWSRHSVRAAQGRDRVPIRLPLVAANRRHHARSCPDRPHQGRKRAGLGLPGRRRDSPGPVGRSWL